MSIGDLPIGDEPIGDAPSDDASITEGVGLGDSESGSVSSTITEAASLGDTIEGSDSGLIFEIAVLEATFAGTIVLPEVLTDTIALTDAFEGVFPLFDIITEAHAFGDTYVARTDTLEVLPTEALALADAFEGEPRPAVTEDLEATDTFTVVASAVIAPVEAAEFDDSLATPTLGSVLRESLALEETFRTDTIAATTEALALTDAPLGSPTSFLSDAHALDDTISVQSIGPRLTEALAVTDALLASPGARHMETIGLSDDFDSSAAGAVLVERVGLNDTYSGLAAYIAQASEGARFNDSLLGSFASALSDSTALSETVVVKLSVALSESATCSLQNLEVLLGLSILEAVALGEAWAGDLHALLPSEPVGLNDTLAARELGVFVIEAARFDESYRTNITSAIEAGTAAGAVFAAVALALNLQGALELDDSFSPFTTNSQTLLERVALGDTFVAATSRITGQIFIDEIRMRAAIQTETSLEPRIEIDRIRLSPSIRTREIRLGSDPSTDSGQGE